MNTMGRIANTQLPNFLDLVRVGMLGDNDVLFFENRILTFLHADEINISRIARRISCVLYDIDFQIGNSLNFLESFQVQISRTSEMMDLTTLYQYYASSNHMNGVWVGSKWITRRQLEIHKSLHKQNLKTEFIALQNASLQDCRYFRAAFQGEKIDLGDNTFIEIRDNDDFYSVENDLKSSDLKVIGMYKNCVWAVYILVNKEGVYEWDPSEFIIYDRTMIDTSLKNYIENFSH